MIQATILSNKSISLKTDNFVLNSDYKRNSSKANLLLPSLIGVKAETTLTIWKNKMISFKKFFHTAIIYVCMQHV